MSETAMKFRVLICCPSCWSHRNAAVRASDNHDVVCHSTGGIFFADLAPILGPPSRLGL